MYGLTQFDFRAQSQPTPVCHYNEYQSETSRLDSKRLEFTDG